MPYYGDAVPLAEYAGKPYMPSNGTEGDCFQGDWCCKCARDKEMNGTCHAEGREATEADWCPILGASYRGEAAEWVFSAEGWPTCTAFIPIGQERAPRDDFTQDMFSGERDATARINP